MPQQGLIYRVLVASPSDCVEERKLVPELIHAWNASHSLHTGAILEPVLWETHARPELGDRPQGIINKQLVDNCDILIGTFWTRLGTSTGKAESGTAEEIEALRSKGKAVLLYFSSAPAIPASINPEQFQALTEYKSKLGVNSLYFEYESLNQLRTLLQGHIASEMNTLHSGKTEHINDFNNGKDDIKDIKEREYVEAVSQFVRLYESTWSSEKNSDPIGIEEGKNIIFEMLNHVLKFKSQIINGLEEVNQIFNDVAIRLRKLQKHRLYMDGGDSFNQFWDDGDEVIEILKSVPSKIRDEMDADMNNAK
jgi:hypothetical protein